MSCATIRKTAKKAKTVNRKIASPAERKAITARAAKLTPNQAYQWVRTAYDAVVNTTPLTGDPFLDHLRYTAALNRILAWRFAKKHGLCELCDECCDAANETLWLVYMDRAAW